MQYHDAILTKQKSDNPKVIPKDKACCEVEKYSGKIYKVISWLYTQ